MSEWISVDERTPPIDKDGDSAIFVVWHNGDHEFAHIEGVDSNGMPVWYVWGCGEVPSSEAPYWLPLPGGPV